MGRKSPEERISVVYDETMWSLGWFLALPSLERKRHPKPHLGLYHKPLGHFSSKLGETL
jgi:hypothetical protein